MTGGAALTSGAVLAALKPLFAVRGVPRFVRSDNGPESVADEVQSLLESNGSAPPSISSGLHRPWLSVAERVHGELPRKVARMNFSPAKSSSV